MLEFRKLAEVEQATELMEGEEVLISDGEKVKKIAPEKIGEHVPENLKKAAVDGNGFGYTDEDGIHQIDSKYIDPEGVALPKVKSAVETGGVGWTDTKEVSAINIIWDGNAEDREYFRSADVTYVKVADAIFNDISELYGAKIVCASEEVILDDNNCLYDEGYYMLNYFGIYLPIDVEDISAGLYFLKARNYYTSSLTKEASTEEVVHQIDEKYIPSSGSGGPEVENAVETHGMGWTSEEEVEGFDIQWDGNTEGLENIEGSLFKVTENLFGINSPSNLIGATVVIISNGEFFSFEVDRDSLVFNDSTIRVGESIYIILKNSVIDESPISKGIWFAGGDETAYVSRLYKEATTEEVVHQIDQKYIPQSSGGAMVVTVVFDDNRVGTADKTLSELATAYESGMNVIAIVKAFNMAIAKVTCIQYADNQLMFGMPVRTDDDGWCLVPLKVHHSYGTDVWETNMI